MYAFLSSFKLQTLASNTACFSPHLNKPVSSLSLLSLYIFSFVTTRMRAKEDIIVDVRKKKTRKMAETENVETGDKETRMRSVTVGWEVQGWVLDGRMAAGWEVIGWDGIL